MLIKTYHQNVTVFSSLGEDLYWTEEREAEWWGRHQKLRGRHNPGDEKSRGLDTNRGKVEI